MNIQIAWGITGAGCWLLESFEILGRLLQESAIHIDLFLSRAGMEVMQCYGFFKEPIPINTPLLDKTRVIPTFNQDIFKKGFLDKYQWLGVKESRKISDFIKTLSKPTKIHQYEKNQPINYSERFNDIIFEIDEGFCFPSAAKAGNNKYDFVVICPATGNTVAKINQGIADGLLSNLALLANKSAKTKVIIVPTDYKIGEVKSYLPVILNAEECKKCEICAALKACKYNAIIKHKNKMQLNRLKCTGCLDCIKICQNNIITFLEEIVVNVRSREANATEQLSLQEGFVVLENPELAYEYLSNEINKLKK